MNWYKKSQLVIKEPPHKVGPTNYLDIGHTHFFAGETEEDQKRYWRENQEKKEEIKKYPNYLWYYDGENIMSEEETKNVRRHGLIEGYDDGFYSGRYESSTGKISIYPPKHRKYLSIPNNIINKLQNKFPDAVYLYVFH